jgi:hypothetical protein
MKAQELIKLCEDPYSKVFLSRKDYDKTIPWSIEAKELASKAKRKDSLAGFEYTFPDPETAQAFRGAIGMAGDE